MVGFIDMDCFYVAVERTRDPSLVGVPCAVVQYNSRQAGGAPDLPADGCRRAKANCGGGIIAVSYEARRRGVTRQMRPAEARKQCPEIVLVQVPTAFGKADLSIYKEAGDSVAQLLAQRAGACEKRSVDEVAVDITAEAARLLQERDWESDLLPAARKASHLADSALSLSATEVSKSASRNGHAGQQLRDVGGNAREVKDPWDWSFFWGQAERVLIAGAVVVAEMRAAVAAELGFECSGGVAQNKILAKLGCGLHKPNQQTVVLPEAVGLLLKSLPLERLPGLGGDLGVQVKEKLAVATAGELAAVPLVSLGALFPRQAEYLQRLAEGRYSEPVQQRVLSNSLSSAKTFFGHLRLNTAAECERWLRELAKELHKRYAEGVVKYRRVPSKISVSIGVGSSTSSRQCPLDLGPSGAVDVIHGAACACFRRWLPTEPGWENNLGVTSLGMSLSAMQTLETSSAPVTRLLRRVVAAASPKDAGWHTASELGPAGGAMEPTLQPRPSVSHLLQRAAADAASTTEAPRSEPASLALIDVDAEPANFAPQGIQGGVDLSVLAALPAGVREEVLAQMPAKVQDELRVQLRGLAGRSGGGAPTPVATPARAAPAAPAAPAAKRRKANAPASGTAAPRGSIAAYFRPSGS